MFLIYIRNYIEGMEIYDNNNIIPINSLKQEYQKKYSDLERLMINLIWWEIIPQMQDVTHIYIRYRGKQIGLSNKSIYLLCCIFSPITAVI